MIPHVNIHSCVSSIGACTPFISNTPGLATHTSAHKRNITETHTPGRWCMDETIDVTLDKGSYMMIAHVRFFTAAGKYDVAFGLPTQVVDEKDDSAKVMFICLVTFGCLVTAITIGFLFRFIYKSVQKFNALTAMKYKLTKEKLDSALEASEHLDYPVTLVSANDFIALGRLEKHEDVRDANKLVFKDTLANVAIFKKTHKIIFFSHQWTAWTEPDHTSKQYIAMKEALATVVTDFGWDLNRVYVWVDYISIPQCVGSVQLLAIHTLTAYSSVADAFIAVCPELQHRETGALCNVDSYRDRMWCRAEQACFALKNGCDRMWLCTEKKNAPGAEGFFPEQDKNLSRGKSRLLSLGIESQHCLSIERMGTEWLEVVLRVFDGNATCCERKHAGMDICDQQALVVPLLSLYAEWFAAKGLNKTVNPLRVVNNVSSLLEEEHMRRKMFPETFGFVHIDGTVTETDLFGDLVPVMERYLNENQELKDMLNGIGRTEADHEVPKRPAMGGVQGRRRSQAHKESAKVHPEVDCSRLHVCDNKLDETATTIEVIDEEKMLWSAGRILELETELTALRTENSALKQHLTPTIGLAPLGR